ncbi:MAG: hypothetical protein J3K34DRAFT_438855 [Monoraphidium minutum]|nr:MAG: hypothetical protein J3K34DRAFT_438855 [Monoraphidium minutum]
MRLPCSRPPRLARVSNILSLAAGLPAARCIPYCTCVARAWPCAARKRVALVPHLRFTGQLGADSDPPRPLSRSHHTACCLRPPPTRPPPGVRTF